MKSQDKMIHRLIDLKRRAAEAAEVAHVAAHDTTRAAESALKTAIDDWKRFADGVPLVASAADLEDRDRQYRWLRAAVERAEKNAQLARNDEARKRELVKDARIELRRYETWLENTEALRRLEAARSQRLADDEVAARKALMGGER